MSGTDGERAAQTTFESHLSPILDAAYHVAMSLTRHRADAEDLVQDAALKAYRGFDGFEAGSNFKAWFFRIVYNCFHTRYRRQKAAEIVAFDESSERALAAHGAGVRPFADAPDALGRMDAEQIAAALWSLPEEYRVVATMYFIDDLSYQDMADVLEIPVGTVRSRLHRGRKLLQARLWTLAVDAGIVTAVTPSSSASPLATRRVALAHSAG